MTLKQQPYVLQLVLILALSLAFFVPFRDPSNNIDLQAAALLVCGLIASLYALFLLVKCVVNRKFHPKSSLKAGLVILFIGSCIATFLTKHTAVNLFGFEGVRIGFLALLSCISIGYVLSRLPGKLFLSYFYISTVALAALSIIYSLIRAHTLIRLGGPFYQADILAVYLGSGLLVGGAKLLHDGISRKVAYSQVLLLVTVLLTETRTVIFILTAMALYHAVSRRLWRNKRVVLASCAALFVIGGIVALSASRVTSSSYALKSVSYRGELVHNALKDISKEPFWGYGQGSENSVLSCHTITGSMLIKTCSEGYGFNSSHNIFLDRILEFGVVGGTLYFLVFIQAIVSSRRKKLLSCILILIGIYYLTNVTNIELELLYWCIVMRILFGGTRFDPFKTAEAKADQASLL